MSDQKQTPLGAFVMAGASQTEAEAITDTTFEVKDISNAYLVTTKIGDLLVNTGFIGNGQRNKGLFAATARRAGSSARSGRRMPAGSIMPTARPRCSARHDP